MRGFCHDAPSALRVSFVSRSIHPVLAPRAYGTEGGAMNKNITVLVLVLAAGCSSRPPYEETSVPPMDRSRKVSKQDCARTIQSDGGNLLCADVSERQRRARIAEEEQQARAKKEAAERAERERLERERAEQLAREEEARKQRAAEEERLAAERRRQEAEAAAAAALKAQQERERQEKAEAEARARQLAEQEAREAAERECLRLAKERLDGRALLVEFVDNYGKIDENKGIARQITAFLAKAQKVKACPPANSTEQVTQTDKQLAKPR